MTPEIYQQIKDFGITSCDEYVVPNPDGSYTIMLNARSATNRLEEAYKHAVEHILYGDLDQEELDVNKIEMIRHGIAASDDKPEPVLLSEEEPVPVELSKEEPIQPIDWEKVERRIQRARKKLSVLNRHNIDNFIQTRLDSGENFFSTAEERWLDPF